MAMAVIRTLIWIWPFISEMFFNGKSFKEIIKAHWGIAILTSLLVFSLFFNYLAFKKIYAITTENPDILKPKELRSEQIDKNDIEKIKQDLISIYQ